MPTRIAVLGASGFIGRYLLEALVSRGIQVIATSRTTSKLSSFADRVEILELDLSNPGEMLFSRLGRPHCVINLAWEGLPNYRSLAHFEVELPRQYRMLKQLVVDGLPSLVVAGTCFEYGLQSGPLSEDVSSCPATPYGLAKDSLHRQLRFLKATTPFALSWARLFYLFGEGQNESSLWSQLASSLKRGDARFPMSAGEQLRDFLPVATVADNLARLAAGGLDVGTVNICSGVPRSIRSLVESWLDQSCDKIELDLGRYPYPDYEPMAFWGDRRKLDSILSRDEQASA